MLFASYNNAQMSSVVLVAVFIAIGATRVITRMTRDSYGYKHPVLKWLTNSSSDNWKLTVNNHRGNGPEVIEMQIVELFGGIQYINYWCSLLAGACADRIAAKPNGSFLDDGSKTGIFCEKLRETREELPVLLQCATDFDRKLLSNIPDAYMYDRKLLVTHNGYKLAFCRLEASSDNPKPWLLIFVELGGLRRYVTVDGDQGLLDASRSAVEGMLYMKTPGIWHDAEKA